VLLSLNCVYLLFVTLLMSESVIEPETDGWTAIVTGVETAIVTESATVPETVLVTEPVNVFVIVIETGSLAPGLRFENHVV
nr:hypothetical protein [Tanacetum cinerariifolium]